MSTISRQVQLASRPTGFPTRENFNIADVELPPIEDGQILIRVIYMSLDPYMRGRMDDGKSYATPVPVGGVTSSKLPLPRLRKRWGGCA